METLHFDANDLISQFGREKLLGDVIQHFEGKFWTDGKVICTIKVNDMKFNRDDEKRFAGEELGSINELEFEVRSKVHLVQDTMVSALDLIADMKRVALEISDVISRTEIGRVGSQLISFLDGCRFFTECLSAIKSGLGNWTRDEENLEQWNEIEREYRNLFQDFLGAMERKDYIYLADLLEYDLPNNLDAWSAQFHEILEKDAASAEEMIVSKE